MSSIYKPIFSNTLAQLVAKFVGAGLTLLTTALIIRLSGPSLFGDLTKSLVLIAIGFTIIDFGLNALAVRRFSQISHPRLLLGEVTSARIMLSFFIIAILNLLVYFLPGGYTPEIKSVFWAGSLAIFFQGIYTSLNAWFQYQENYWYSSYATIGGTLVGTLLTLYFILTSPTLLSLLIAQTLGYFVMALFSIYFARSVFTFTFNFRQIARILVSAAPLGAILLGSVLASKLDTIILGIFRSSAEVGEYGFAYRIFDVILVLPVFIMNATYPRLVKSSRSHARDLIRSALPILGGLGILIAIVVWFVAPWILLIRPALGLAVISLRILILSLPLFFLTAPLMWQLITFAREKLVLKIYLAAALLNGAINLWSIPRYGVLAAAVTTGLTELFIYLCLLYFSHETPPQLRRRLPR